MNVRELIALLKEEDPSMQVHFAYNSGDHWRTVVAPVVRKVEVTPVRFSDYHDKDKLVDDDTTTPEDREVLVLR